MLNLKNNASCYFLLTTLKFGLIAPARILLRYREEKNISKHDAELVSERDKFETLFYLEFSGPCKAPWGESTLLCSLRDRKLLITVECLKVNTHNSYQDITQTAHCRLILNNQAWCLLLWTKWLQRNKRSRRSNTDESGFLPCEAQWCLRSS